MSRQRPAPSAARIPISRLRTGRAREHQVGDVGAGDEQHEPNRAEQEQHPRPHPPDQVVMEADDAHAPAWAPLRVLLVERHGDAVHLLVRLFESTRRVFNRPTAVQL